MSAPTGVPDKVTVFVNSIKTFLAPIWPLLEDEKITEVMVNRHDEIWVEVRGKIQKTDAKFKDEDALRSAVNNIAQSVAVGSTTKNRASMRACQTAFVWPP